MAVLAERPKHVGPRKQTYRDKAEERQFRNS